MYALKLSFMDLPLIFYAVQDVKIVNCKNRLVIFQSTAGGVTNQTLPGWEVTGLYGFRNNMRFFANHAISSGLEYLHCRPQKIILPQGQKC
jgi:hypothetical protein